MKTGDDMQKQKLSVAFVVLAAGKGERLGGVAKQFRRLGEKPVWRWSFDTARTLCDEGIVDEIVLALPPGASDVSDALPELPHGVKIAFGGASRSESVLNSLRACDSDIVLLHDAARPFVSADLTRRILSASNGENAVIPLLAETNALKKICGRRLEAVDRDGIYITQTPQLFPSFRLMKILESARSLDFKDEAEAWLADGGSLDWVTGDESDFKITAEGDWRMACLLAQAKILENSQAKKDEVRAGLGYDVHPLTPGRRLVLGGVEIPSPLGLSGHSDADALCHAIADAILSAAGLPDIGTLYPASDEKYSGADSTLLLKDSLRRVSALGWSVEWVSVVLTAQVPKLSPWHEKILASLNGIFGADVVSLTFKSGEHVPPVGDAEAVFAWASATLRR